MLTPVRAAAAAAFDPPPASPPPGPPPLKADYDVVNCLDEEYNPGLREAIKEFSTWPTIPQLYIEGEFVGGADIVQEMALSGELKTMCDAAMASKKK